MKKYLMFLLLMMPMLGSIVHAQATEPKKTGNEWHAAGDAIPRSRAFADDLKKRLGLDDVVTKKVFQLYLGNTKSVDEIKLSAMGDTEKKAKLQRNADSFDEKIKEILSADQFKKYELLPKSIY